MMTVDLDKVQGKTEVYGSDGEKVGSVRSLATDRETGIRYLEVITGLGGRFGGQDLYIPEPAISHAELGDDIRLAVTSEEAKAQFDVRPNIL